MSNPRKFWIENGDFDLGFQLKAVAEYPHKDSLDNPDLIKVIEYQAFEQGAQRIAELEAEVKDLNNSLSCLTRSIINDELETCPNCLDNNSIKKIKRET